MNRRETRVLLAGLVLFLGAPLQARAGETYLHLEPVLGWEKTDAVFDPPRSLYRLIYGARGVAGYKRVALEGAYLRGSLEDRVPSQDYSASESTEVFQGGLRYVHPVFSFFTVQARGGWEVRKVTLTETLSSVTVSAVTPWKGRPYLGVGATLRPFAFFAATAQLSATFEDPTNLLHRISPQLSFGIVLSPF